MIIARIRSNALFLTSLACSALVSCSKGAAERAPAAFDLGSVETELPPENIADDLPREQTPVGKHGRLSVVGTDLVDKTGNPVQLRGISSMWLNMESTGYATSGASLKWMRDNWGVSLVRAAMGVGEGDGRSSNGGYLTNPTRMLALVERMVENATKLGVYVIIDWHDHVAQDHVDEAEAFFSDMAARYADHDNVLYEVYNEPVPGIRNPATFEVERSFTWEQDFKPYHERLVGAIRAHDPEGVVILGTPMWSQEVDKAAADPVAGTNLMYTLHFYSCTHTGWLRDRAQAAREAGLPIFVTEWGATYADGGVQDKTVCVDESDQWHAWMDANRVSWAAWKLDDCVDASCLLVSGTRPGTDWTASLQGHGQYVVDKLLAKGSDGAPPVSEPGDSGAPLSTADAGAATTTDPSVDEGTAEATAGDAAVPEADLPADGG